MFYVACVYDDGIGLSMQHFLYYAMFLQQAASIAARCSTIGYINACI